MKVCSLPLPVRAILALLFVVVILFLLIIIWGGGWGEKPPLPPRLAHADSPLIFAHRGHNEDMPENSLGGVEAALQQGFQAVELDVQKSRDDSLFVFHDADGERLLGMEDQPSQRSWNELKDLPLFFDGRPTGERLPSLTEVVESYGDRLVFFFDFKRNHNRNFAHLAAVWNRFIERHNLYDSVVLAEGNVLFILYLEWKYPRIQTCLQGFDGVARFFYFLIPTRFRPDFIACYEHLIDDDYLAWLQRHNLMPRFILYTVNPENYPRVKARGFQKFIADWGSYLDEQLPDPPAAASPASVGLPR